MANCEPKEIRKGVAWHQAVNQPGFITRPMKDAHAERHSIIKGLVIGRTRFPSLAREAAEHQIQDLKRITLKT
jgi:hypothetical protein